MRVLILLLCSMILLNCKASNPIQKPSSFTLSLHPNEQICETQPFKFIKSGRYWISYKWTEATNDKTSIPSSLKANLQLNSGKDIYFTHKIKLPESKVATGTSYYFMEFDNINFTNQLSLELCAIITEKTDRVSFNLGSTGILNGIFKIDVEANNDFKECISIITAYPK